MSGSGEGFGPVGPGVAGAPPFAVAGPSRVTVDTSRSGSASFAVSNVSGRPVRARFMVVPGAGADASWFEVAGESERALPVAATATVDVAVRVPEEAPAGSFSFVFGVSLEESPDQVVSGPTVGFEVPEREKRKFPWWIVIVAAVALVLLVAGGILIWNLTRGDAQPTLSPNPTPEVFTTGQFVANPEIVVDLDNAQQWNISDPVRPKRSPDIILRQGAGSGELMLRGYDDTRLAVVGEASYKSCETAAGHEDDEVQDILLLPGRDELFVCVQFTDEGRRAVMTFGTRLTSIGPLADYTVWDRVP